MQNNNDTKSSRIARPRDVEPTKRNFESRYQELFEEKDDVERNVRARNDFGSVRSGDSSGAGVSGGPSRSGDGGGATPTGAGAGGFGGVPNVAGGGATPPGVVAVAGDVAGAVTNQVPAPVTPPAHTVPLGNEYLNATPGTRKM